jgi:hypothetical protein
MNRNELAERLTDVIIEGCLDLPHADCGRRGAAQTPTVRRAVLKGVREFLDRVRTEPLAGHTLDPEPARTGSQISEPGRRTS